MRRAIVTSLLCGLVIVPAPASAGMWEDPEPAPSWVRGTVVCMMLLGGCLYLHNRIEHRGDVEPKSLKQNSLDLIAYVSTPEERAELEKLDSEEGIQTFMTRFFDARDPDPSTPENEFRAELVARYRDANERYGDQAEGWRSDRGRVHILYGPPAEITRAERVDNQDPARLEWKYVEFWEYDRPAGSNPPPPILETPGLFDSQFRVPMPTRGRMLFIFARGSDGGRIRQVYSTEGGEPSVPEIVAPAH